MEVPKWSLAGTNWPDMGRVSITEPVVDGMFQYWFSSNSRGKLESKNESTYSDMVEKTGKVRNELWGSEESLNLRHCLFFFSISSFIEI